MKKVSVDLQNIEETVLFYGKIYTTQFSDERILHTENA